MIEDRLQVRPVLLLGHDLFGHFRHLFFSRPSFCRRRIRLQRCLVGDAIQPVADHFSRHDGCSLADKDEEGRLESVLDILMVVEHPSAYIPDHGAMPPHERFEGRCFTAVDEALKQLPIRRLLPKHRLVQVLDDVAHLAGCHVLTSVARNLLLSYYPFGPS